MKISMMAVAAVDTLLRENGSPLSCILADDGSHAVLVARTPEATAALMRIQSYVRSGAEPANVLQPGLVLAPTMTPVKA